MSNFNFTLDGHSVRAEQVQGSAEVNVTIDGKHSVTVKPGKYHGDMPEIVACDMHAQHKHAAHKHG